MNAKVSAHILKKPHSFTQFKKGTDSEKQTYKQTVEELVQTETEHADDEISDVVDKLEVDQDMVPWLGERPTVAHRADSAQNTIHHLDKFRVW